LRWRVLGGGRSYAISQAILARKSHDENPELRTVTVKTGEDALLGKIARQFAHASRTVAAAFPVGIGDDAAIYAPRAGCETILTCDWFLEGTHFLRDKHPADAVGWKCLARAISDVAAMGGVPRCFLLSLALPETHLGPWLDAFLGGLRRASQRFHCALAGGDTTKRRDILINITIIGEVPTGKAVLRRGARPGDILYVSGRLGEAERGLRLLESRRGLAGEKDRTLRRHLYPHPRLALGSWLREKRLATAMMDLSDGLSSDLPRLCLASGVGARIEASRLPAVQVSADGQTREISPIQLALHGGDDYELLFAVPRRKTKFVPRSLKGVRLTAIGEITRRREIVLAEPGGREVPLKPGGWDPFRHSKEKRQR
jgi:thiamine-monophosphate kinase